METGQRPCSTTCWVASCPSKRPGSTLRTWTAEPPILFGSWSGCHMDSSLEKFESSPEWLCFADSNWLTLGGRIEVWVLGRFGSFLKFLKFLKSCFLEEGLEITLSRLNLPRKRLEKTFGRARLSSSGWQVLLEENNCGNCSVFSCSLSYCNNVTTCFQMPYIQNHRLCQAWDCPSLHGIYGLGAKFTEFYRANFVKYLLGERVSSAASLRYRDWAIPCAEDMYYAHTRCLARFFGWCLSCSYRLKATMQFYKFLTAHLKRQVLPHCQVDYTSGWMLCSPRHRAGPESCLAYHFSHVQWDFLTWGQKCSQEIFKKMAPLNLKQRDAFFMQCGVAQLEDVEEVGCWKGKWDQLDNLYYPALMYII